MNLQDKFKIDKEEDVILKEKGENEPLNKIRKNEIEKKKITLPVINQFHSLMSNYFTSRHPID